MLKRKIIRIVANSCWHVVMCIILFYVFLLPLGFLNKIHAQTPHSISRVYIPTSNQTTVLKTKDSQSLLIKDYLGSTRQVDGKNSNAGTTYLPYGEESNPKNLGTDRAFTGHRKLDETGIYHAGARFYSPQFGQFLQADKVEGSNRYRYANNNPIIFLDYSGNEAVSSNTIYPVGLTFDFPNSLPMTDKNYTQRFSDPVLQNLAANYILRNPYNPQTQKREFVEYLVHDIYTTVPYAPGVVGPRNEYRQQMRNLRMQYTYFDRLSPRLLGDTLDEGIKNKVYAKSQTALAINSLEATKIFVDKKSKEATDYYNTLNLAQRIGQGNAMCWDFCDFTGYTLAQVGIPTGIGGTSEFHHAFGIVDIDGTPFMFDTTWDYTATFYEDRMGRSKHPAYNSFGFQTPWGNPFAMNIHQEKLEHNPANNNEDVKLLKPPQSGGREYIAN